MSRVKCRQPYKPEQSAELARIDEKRRRLGVTGAELAAHVGINERTLRRMFKDGRAWPRHVRALTFALRTIERELRAEDLVLK